MAIQDFGQKIGGARKDLWSWRGLMTSDIENFNKAERDKYIKKNNIWLKPDYEKMLNEEGYERDALYFIKNVRDSIPTGPELRYSDSEERIREKQEQYIDFINDIKQRLLEVKTSEDIDKFTLNYLVNQGYVKKAGFHRYDVMPAGEAFITGVVFVIAFFVLFSFILPIHGNDLQKVIYQIITLGGMVVETVTQPPGQITVAFLNIVNIKSPLTYNVIFSSDAGIQRRSERVMERTSSTGGLFVITHHLLFISDSIAQFFEKSSRKIPPAKVEGISD